MFVYILRRIFNMSIKKLQNGIRRLTGVNVRLRKTNDSVVDYLCYIPVSLIELFKDEYKFDYYLDMDKKIRHAGKVLSVELIMIYDIIDEGEFIQFLQPNVDWVNNQLENLIGVPIKKDEGFSIDSFNLSLEEFYIYVNMVLSSPDGRIYNLLSKNKVNWLSFKKRINNLMASDAPLISDDVFYNV